MRSDAQANRQDLLVTAARLISEQGEGVSMRVIAQTADVGIGTLYRHFPTRDDLMIGLATSILDEIDRAAERFHDSEDTASSRWKSYIADLADLHLGALAGALRADDQLRDVDTLVAHRDATMTRMAAVLQAAQRAALIRSDVTVARFLLGIIQFTRPLPVNAPAELTAELPWLLSAFARGLAPAADESASMDVEA